MDRARGGTLTREETVMSRKATGGSERRKPLTPAERRRLAEAGDVAAILEELGSTPWLLVEDQEEKFLLLLRALEVAGREDAAANSEQLFARMAAFAASLVMRSHFLITRILATHDRHNGSRAAQFFPRDLTSEHLAQVLDLQTHLAQLLEAQARTARLWQLARRPESPAASRRRDRGEQQEPAARSRVPGPNGAARRPSHPEVPLEVADGTDD